MTAAELLLDLSERLEEADRRLMALAHENRFRPAVADTFASKAQGIRLALSYVTELQRMTGEDFT